MPAPRGPRSGPRSGGTLQNISGGFAWWFGRVDVDPVNPQHVFVEGVSLAESLNGGATWTTSQTPHADQHAVEFDPFTPGKVFLGNDGGFYWSTAERRRPRALVEDRAPARDAVLRDGRLAAGRPRVNAGAQDNGSLKSWGQQTTSSTATGSASSAATG